MNYLLHRNNSLIGKLCCRIAIAIQFIFLYNYSIAASVTVNDWVARLSVFYAAVAIMIIVDAIAIYFILKSLRRSSGD
jgi:hypothetical protein